MSSTVILAGPKDLDIATFGLPPDILPDQLRVVSSPEPMILRYLQGLIRYLTCEDRTRRRVAEEALGVELTHLLYPKLFDEINASVAHFIVLDVN
jgi:hypothetical protein